jgi:predicted nucleotidyltransferase
MLNPHFKEILSTFNAENVEYLLVGAFGVAAHGIPRSTGDIDLWVHPTEPNAESVWNALKKFGAPLDDLSKKDFQTTDTVVQIGVSPQRIDILTSIDAVEFPDAWKQKVLVEIEGVRVNLISKHHLIANKRATGRPQDLADADRLSRL